MKKALKLGAAVLAFGLIALLLAVTNALTGNPVSRWAAHRAAEGYVAETYPEQKLEISKTNYSFKTGSYLAFVSNPDSVDTHFTLDISMTGKILYDRYESHVLSGFNTWQRMDDSYRQEVAAVLETLPYSFSIGYGTLVQAQEGAEDSDGVPYGLAKLELDGDYPLTQLGTEAGKLVLYSDTEAADAETAAQVLTDVRDAFADAGVPFRAVDLSLQAGEESFAVRELPREVLDQQPLKTALEEYAALTEEYYRRLDEEEKDF